MWLKLQPGDVLGLVQFMKGKIRVPKLVFYEDESLERLVQTNDPCIKVEAPGDPATGAVTQESECIRAQLVWLQFPNHNERQPWLTSQLLIIAL